MVRFSGSRIVVTGAASGLGLATAIRLAREGAEVIGLDLRPPPSREISVAFHAVDVSDEIAVEAAIRQILSDGRPIDGLATFAGIERPGRIEEIGDGDWTACFRVNVMGTVHAVKSALPGLVASGKGSVVLCSTQLSISGGRNCVAYAATKGAINSLCKGLALDLAAQRIRVNAVAPGAIETPMMDRVFSTASAEAIAASRARHPLGRFGSPDEVASLACHLLSEEASFTTGVVIPVDGGWTAA